MLNMLDKEISYHKNNIRGWFVEPENWENNKRLTYRQVAEKIAKDKDLSLRKHTVYYDGKRLRPFPLKVCNYIQSMRRQKK